MELWFNGPAIAGDDAGGDDRRGSSAGSVLPPAHRVTYSKELLELALLAIAVPWLLYRLVVDPRGVLRGAAEHHLAS